MKKSNYVMVSFPLFVVWTLICMITGGLIVLGTQFYMGKSDSEFDQEWISPVHLDDDFVSNTAADLLTERNCLRRAVYYEAGNQNNLGKLAVATVIMNRVQSRKFHNTICGVIGAPRQFSFMGRAQEKPKNIIDDAAWLTSRWVAEAVMFNPRLMSFPVDVMYYHATYISPPVWTKRLTKHSQIGDHIFYH